MKAQSLNHKLKLTDEGFVPHARAFDGAPLWSD